MAKKLRFVFAAGGTGGHILPAIAVAEILRDRKLAEVKFVGIGRELERKIIQGAGFEQQIVPSLPVVGAGVFGALKALCSLPRNVFTAQKFYREYRPDVVVGFGGFPAFVPVLAAALSRIPVVMQEQNVKVGVANRFASLLATRIYAVPGSHGFLIEGPLIGGVLRKLRRPDMRTLANPVRAAFGRVREWRPPENEDKFVILVVGGSQGARAINHAMVEMADVFLKCNIKVIHQTGPEQCLDVQKAYIEKGITDAEVVPFIDKIVDYYERAHLVISRSGAMTVAEVMRTGRPAIFIPLPIAGGHQIDNILEIKRMGLAVVVEQTEHLATDLALQIESLVASPAKLDAIAKGLRVYAGVYGSGSEGDAANTLAKDLSEMVSNV